MAFQEQIDHRAEAVGSLQIGNRRRVFAALLFAVGVCLTLGAAAALSMGALAQLNYNYDAFAHLRLQFALAALGGAGLIALAGAWRGAFCAALIGAAGLLGLGPAWETPVAAPEECVAARLTLATANVHDENPDFDALVDALLATDADILSTQESVSRFWSASRRLRTRYPHRLTHIPNKGRTRSVMLWSKHPIRPIRINPQQWNAPGLAMAEIDLAGRAVLVAGLHGGRPVLAPQQDQYEALAAIFADAPPARVVMGDFNATLWSHGLATAQRGVGAEAVPGYRITWRGAYPNPIWRRRGWKPPAIIGNQIDHLLITEHFGVERIETFELPGSVHHGLSAVIQLKKPTPECGA